MPKFPISDFYHGIANGQPPQRRQNGQVKEAENAQADVLDGMRKRNPLIYKAGLPLSAADYEVANVGGVRIFFNGASISAFKEDGTAVPIDDATSTGFAYLSGADREDLDWVVALDTVIICNRNTVVVADDYPNYTVAGEYNNFSELPGNDPDHGNPVTNAYYRVLDKENSDPAGYYQWDGSKYNRVPPPGDEDASYDLTTMPHRLVYDPDANLITYSTIPFEKRLSGSSRTNLILPIVGEKIKSVNYFQSRLVLLTEKNLNLSYNSNIFRLFVNDMDTIVVQDRISKDILESNIGRPLRTAVINNTLIITCENAVLAFDAELGNASLTNANGAIRKIADLKCADVKPTTNGSYMYFVDQFNQIQSLAIANIQVGVQNFGSLNDYDPSLLQGVDIKQIYADADTLYVLGTEGELYVHDSKIINGKFVQLAWTKYTNRQHKIRHIDTWQNKVRIVSETSLGSLCFLEYTHRKPENDPGLDHKVRLDIRELKTGTYFSNKDRTRFEHSVDNASTDYSYIVNATTGQKLKCVDVDGKYAFFEGKLEGDWYLGFNYRYRVKLNNVWAGSLDLRVMGKSFSLFYTDSTDFDLIIGRINGRQRRMHWQTPSVNKGIVGQTLVNTGVYTTFVMGDLRYIDIAIESDSPGPLTVNAIGYEVNGKGGK